MKKLLKEYFPKLLKEEIDYSTKIATVYHLTGNMTAHYDKAWERIVGLTKDKLDKEIEDKYRNKKNNRTTSILKNIKKHSAGKELDFLQTPQGKAYHISDSIGGDTYSMGSAFKAGGGAMYGKGLYTCYELNREIARTYGDTIVRFEVNLTNFLIFNKEIAQKICGEDFSLEKQFENILQRTYGKDINTILSESTPDSAENFKEFFKKLESVSTSEAFETSKHTGTRTAMLCLSLLNEFSQLFNYGDDSRLRYLIDGVVFWGMNDGPVCVIYHPEINSSYTYTGIGYFDHEKGPIIYPAKENLRGRSGVDMKDAAAVSRDTDEDSVEQYLKFKRDNIEKAMNFKKFEGEDPNRARVLEDNEVCKDIFYKWFMNNKDLATDIIWKRYSVSQTEVDKYYECLKNMILLNITGPSVLLKPIFDIINIIGPGLEIISENELYEYITLIKSFLENSTRIESNIQLHSSKLKLRPPSEINIQELQHLLDELRKVIDTCGKDMKSLQDYTVGEDESVNFSFGNISDMINISLDTSYDGEIFNDLNSNKDFLNDQNIIKNKLKNNPDLLHEYTENSDLISTNGINIVDLSYNAGAYSNDLWGWAEFCYATAVTFYESIDMSSLPFQRYNVQADVVKVLEILGLKTLYPSYSQFINLNSSTIFAKSPPEMIDYFNNIISIERMKELGISDKADNLISACFRYEADEAFYMGKVRQNKI